jgi:signal transduction histidine kinase
MKKLYARIYLHFLGVLVVVGLASSVVFAIVGRTDLLRNWTVRLATHAAWAVGRQPEGQARAQMVKHLSDELGIDVTLRAPDGTVLTSVGDALPALSEEDRQRISREGASILAKHRWIAVAPVREHANGPIVGFLLTAPMHRFAPWNLLRPLVMVTVVLLVVGLATFPLARRISRPVEQLTEASRRLGEGDLAYRIPCEGPRWHPHHHRHHHVDELFALKRAWNDMAGRVEKLVRGQRELLANVSHELRSPLARIRLALELLPNDDATSARRREVSADLDELERLIDDVLTTSRLDATGLPTHIAPVQIAELCAQLAERAAHDPLTAGQPLRVDVDGAGTIEADAGLLKRALWNLVENAAKYGTPPIELRARREAGGVLLTVIDQGSGIPPEDRERVFDPFFRRDRARTPGAAGDRGGYGLGLTLARRVAEVHGGTIRIGAAHDDGRGCSITIEIPT